MRLLRSSTGIAIERPWYPVELPLRYEFADRSSTQGSGQTLAISSGAVRFTGDQDMPIGRNVRLVVSWPAKLADGACLSLSIIGKIEKAAGCEIQVAIIRHEFRVRRTDGGDSTIPMAEVPATVWLPTRGTAPVSTRVLSANQCAGPGRRDAPFHRSDGSG